PAAGAAPPDGGGSGSAGADGVPPPAAAGGRLAGVAAGDGAPTPGAGGGASRACSRTKASSWAAASIGGVGGSPSGTAVWCTSTRAAAPIEVIAVNATSQSGERRNAGETIGASRSGASQ